MIHSTVVCMSVSYYCSSFPCGLFLPSLPACLLLLLFLLFYSFCHTPCFIRLLKGNEAKQKIFSLIGQYRIRQQQQITTRKTVISYTAFEYFIYITTVKFTCSPKIFITVIFDALSKINMVKLFAFRRVKNPYAD